MWNKASPGPPRTPLCSYAAIVYVSDIKKYLEAQYEKMKAAELTRLSTAVKQFYEAMTYFEKSRCADPDEAKQNLRQLPSKSAKVTWL